jgi:hypothetical protein
MLILFSKNAAAVNIRPLHISAPVLAELATTAGGVLFGAWAALQSTLTIFR